MKKDKLCTNNWTCVHKIKMKKNNRMYMCNTRSDYICIKHVLENLNTNMVNLNRVSLLMLVLRMLNYIGNYLKSVRVLTKRIYL